MNILGMVHLASAFLGLISGFVVAISPKGTPFHKNAGWAYVSSMVVVNVTAFLIYDLFGGFGPFHAAALLSGITVVFGMIPALRRRPPRHWIPRHAYWMSGSYVGLVAAAVAETTTRYLELPFALGVAAASTLVIVLGIVVIRRKVPAILKNYGF